jgi:hypothetical protein
MQRLFKAVHPGKLDLGNYDRAKLGRLAIRNDETFPGKTTSYRKHSPMHNYRSGIQS